jgi:hypothetical protein
MPRPTLKKLAQGKKEAPAPRKTTLDPAMVQAIAEGVKRELSSTEGWFGPGKPQPDIGIDDARGRLLQYPVALNLRQRPRDDGKSEITFEMLRTLADSCDLLRVVIEKRKDQIEGVSWDISMREDKTAPAVEDIKLVRQFFLRPSSEHDWSGWIRCLLEDVLVLDAVVLYPRQTKGGSIYSLDLIDAATIKRVVDITGRTPAPPLPAYQQVLHGAIAANYTVDELDYFMRNPRTDRLYGRSPVEWVITTVNTAIRRSLHQLSYYTEGNVPEALATAPDGWTMAQVREFQTYWDDLMEGNLAQRRHLKMVPFDATKIKETKQVELKDMFDEWLSRLVCFAFGISPSALIKDQNRATAQQVGEQSTEEGLLPFLTFLENKISYLIQRRLGFPDLCFKWNYEEDVDPQVQANIDKIYVDMKALTPDEVRKERLGKDPLTPEERDKAWPNPMAEMLGPDGKPKVGPDGKPLPFGAKGKAPPFGAKDEDDDEEPPDKKGKPTIGKLVIAPQITIPERQVRVDVGDVNVTADISEAILKGAQQ